ncbi:hypothetical protein KPH14_009858 [Odynerus spinipes]|uniref:Uncharacterized protein n=1 Tax=Odynerus spinipes TaxID=1348599 RepID=A0AAD9RWT9_9HYME|nr:hypothetical protein KPH14_009858 [Odynerus spinipes]
MDRIRRDRWFFDDPKWAGRTPRPLTRGETDGWIRESFLEDEYLPVDQAPGMQEKEDTPDRSKQAESYATGK